MVKVRVSYGEIYQSEIRVHHFPENYTSRLEAINKCNQSIKVLTTEWTRLIRLIERNGLWLWRPILPIAIRPIEEVYYAYCYYDAIRQTTLDCNTSVEQSAVHCHCFILWAVLSGLFCRLKFIELYSRGYYVGAVLTGLFCLGLLCRCAAKSGIC